MFAIDIVLFLFFFVIVVAIVIVVVASVLVVCYCCCSGCQTCRDGSMNLPLALVKSFLDRSYNTQWTLL